MLAGKFKMERQAVYKLKHKIRGPVFIDNSTLLKLDKVYSDVVERIENALAEEKKEIISKIAKEHDCDTENEEEIQEFATYDERRKLNQTTNTFLKIEGQDRYFPKFLSFEDAKLSSEIDADFKKFTYEISTDKYEGFKVKIEFDVDTWSGIEIECKPEDHPVIETVFTEIRRWAETVRPPKWSQIWSEVGGLFSWVLVIMGLVIFPFNFQSKSKTPTKLELEVREILEVGVNNNNIYRATENILKMLHGDPLYKYSASEPSWSAYTILFVILICAIAAYIRPTQGRIGLGNGEVIIEWWRRWIKLVTYGVPSFLILYTAQRIMDKLELF